MLCFSFNFLCTFFNPISKKNSISIVFTEYVLFYRFLRCLSLCQLLCLVMNRLGYHLFLERQGLLYYMAGAQPFLVVCLRGIKVRKCLTLNKRRPATPCPKKLSSFFTWFHSYQCAIQSLRGTN